MGEQPEDKLALVYVGDDHVRRTDKPFGLPRRAAQELVEFCRTCQMGAEFQEAEAVNA